MKKLIKVLCACLAVSMLLCSCGSNSAGPETQEQTDKNFEQGMNYWYGINGVDFDMEKAREYFKLSLDSGNEKALYWLGNIRSYDQDKDRFAEVLDYYQKSADTDHGYGYYGLGTLYETGYWVEKNIEKALEYYNKALDLGCEMGAVALGIYYGNGSHMDNGVETDSEKAEEYFLKALESKDFETRNAARVQLGNLYYYGIGKQVDMAKAESYYKPADEEGYYLGNRMMGNLYRYGDNKDSSKMLEHYEKEIRHGYGYSLAETYLNGVNGVAQDPKKGVEMLNENIEKGDRSAAMSICGLVYAYASGTGVDQDKEEAIRLAYRAIDACGPFDDSDDPNDRLHKPLPYARYILYFYGVPYDN